MTPKKALAFLSLLFCATAPLRADAILMVRPIDVCDSSTLVCGNSAEQLFSLATEAIWAQAGIVIDFLPWGRVSAPATDYSNLNSLGAFGALDALSPFQSDPLQVIWLWFVPQVSSCAGQTGAVYGCSQLNGNNAAVTAAAFSFDSGIGRIDTIAHELGHSLGLPDCGACDADNLEATGGLRNVPHTVTDIYPNGPGYDQLTAAQIRTAHSSAFLFPSSQVETPEPGTLLLALGGSLCLWLRARRAKAA